MSRSQASLPLHTPICDQLEIRYPIILAGMGGAACPELAAAVSNAGGLGVIGAAGLEPSELDEWIRRTRRLTSAPFGVDTLLPTRVPEDTSEEQLRAALPSRYREVAEEIRRFFQLPATAGLGSLLPAFSRSFFDRQLEVIMDQQVPVYAAGLGDPSRFVEEFHRRGTKVLGIVGNVRNARRIVEGGVDAVVAQGHDAGGHNSRIGTMALVPQVVDAVADRVPVVAAGGIGDGRGMVAAMALGAQAVWMGTRFLVAHEACIPDGQKQKILDATEEDTMVTRYLTGKPVRHLKTPLPDEFEKRGLEPLPMPQMGLISGPLFAAATEASRFDLNPGPAGQISGMLTRRQPAAQIVEHLVEEASRALSDLGNRTQ